MDKRPVGTTELSVTPIGFGAFKIGRAVGTKYQQAYELPSDAVAERLLNDVLDLGINLIDTAPAYGISEERIGKFIAHRRDEFVLSTKAGEVFVDGKPVCDFSRKAIERSIARSRERLRSDVLDIMFVHSDGNDMAIIEHGETLDALLELREQGVIRAVGFSGKTVQGARAAMKTCDVLMIEYHPDDTSHADVLAECAAAGVGVFIKKGLASGKLPPIEAIPFALRAPAVSSLVIGGLNIEHIKANVEIARACDGAR